ncbi:MAG TPA: ComEA family DNA-binding protein [Candidatus Latescibacteria bacterium]|nr:ComEA family DNA-binding protein [Candidatus Latescibacterota bacterium]HJP30030.1 ComEA family DNA-binding protein [Candidatus Latescibacterota bacterium]
MIDLNRQEAVAVLFLSGALLVGTGVACLDYLDDERFEDFHVIAGAVEVPSQPEAVQQEAGPLSINRADAERLQSLPHVGPKTAAAIVEYRQAHGLFTAIDDLSRVRGIGAATVERLRPLVSTD